MSDNKQTGADITESIDKAEAYVRDNKKSLFIIGGAAMVVLLAYFAYNTFIVKPQEENARKEMFIAERYFGQDSVALAIKGDGSYPGFEEVVSEYSSAPSGNLSQYYLGISYLKKGEYQKAIDALKSYDAEDDITGALALGGIGSAYLELNNSDEALKYYIKAADWDENNFSRPYFLMRSAMVYEMKKDYTSAIGVYEQIRKDYPTSTEARDIDKYIARAEALSGKI